MKEFLCCLFLWIQLNEVLCSQRTVFLDRNCGESIILSLEENGALQLELTSEEEYKPFTDCHITVVTNNNMQIGINFLEMDIMSFHTCQGDYLQIYDGVEITNTTFLFTSLHQHKRFCGNDRPSQISSHHNNITFRFVSDGYFSSKGFSILLTAFHTGSCRDHEYQCSNSRCIHKDLYCDPYDNCGDDSDLCHINLYITVGIVTAIFIAFISLVFMCAVLHYRFKKHHEHDDTDFDIASLGREYQAFTGNSNCSASTTDTISIITRASSANDCVAFGQNLTDVEQYFWRNQSMIC